MPHFRCVVIDRTFETRYLVIRRPHLSRVPVFIEKVFNESAAALLHTFGKLSFVIVITARFVTQSFFYSKIFKFRTTRISPALFTRRCDDNTFFLVRRI